MQIYPSLTAKTCHGPAGMFMEEAGIAHWEKVMRINFMGVVCTLKAALPGMVSRNKGRVVVTNSSGGFMGARRCAYSTLLRPGFLGNNQLSLAF